MGKETLLWLGTDWVYGYFSRQRAACIRQYRKFVLEGVRERYRKEFHSGNLGGQLLGGDDFAENVFKQLEARPVKPPTVKK